MFYCRLLMKMHSLTELIVTSFYFVIHFRLFQTDSRRHNIEKYHVINPYICVPHLKTYSQSFEAESFLSRLPRVAITDSVCPGTLPLNINMFRNKLFEHYNAASHCY